MKILNKILNTIYPQNYTCNICGDEVFSGDDKSICNACENSLPKISGKVCERCGEPIWSMATYCDRCQHKNPKFYKCRSAFLYKDEVVKLIRDFKFSNKRYLCNHLAKYLEELYIKENFSCDVIVPVPIHSERLKQRGYNQSELLANRLGEILNIPVDKTNLIKVKQTLNQADLNFKQRQENLKDAFKVVDKNAFCGKNVLIIDDVYTTGSTINNCAVVLQKAKAKRVFALTIAHTILE